MVENVNHSDLDTSIELGEENTACAGPSASDHEACAISFDDPNDHRIPSNWTSTRKYITVVVALIGTLILTLNGTGITVAAEEINDDFHVSDGTIPNSYWPVTSWSVGGAIFIIFGLPLLEDLGVRIGYLIFYAFFLLMLIPQAVAQNFATLIVTRFFSGGCVALLANVVSSIIPDIFKDERTQSLWVNIYIFIYVFGSTLGPPVFGGVVQYIGNWRWIVYIQLIMYGAFFPISAIALRETRESVIFRRHVKTIRKKTGKPVLTEAETTASPLSQRLFKSATRPLYLLISEPVLFAGTMWSAFSFGLVFLFTQSITQVFEELYDWQPYSTGYVQAAMAIGEVIGGFATLVSAHLISNAAQRNEDNEGDPSPETRLYVGVVGSFAGLVGGMFVYAWTSYPSIPWIAPAIGIAMVGVGVQCVVTAVSDYITNIYAASGYAGSAISAVAFGENIVAGFLPLATPRLYNTLGLQWASSLLALLAILLSAAPILFVWKGEWFRARSPFMQASWNLK